MAVTHLSGRKFPYEIRHANPRANDTRIAAHCRCGNCGEWHFVTVGTRGDNPEFVAKRFIDHGWEFDLRNASRCVCQTCIAARKAAPVKAALGLTPVATVHLNGPARSPGAVATAMEEAVKSAATNEVAPHVDPAALIKALTGDQRMKIRARLDAAFDDSRGCYLDGLSDQKIGEELGIAWAAVAALREVAYGPITADPALDDVAAMIKTADEAMREISARVGNIEKELKSRIDAVTQSIASAARQIDVAARKLDEARKRIGLK